MVLETEGTFDAAHMLSDYQGKCNNLHGHTYRYKITISAPITDDMVIDFNDIKNVIDIYDHALIVASPDKQSVEEKELMEWGARYHKRYVVMDSGRPTAENMSQEIAELLKRGLEDSKSVKCFVAVRLWETPRNCVEASV